ncbi:HD domain-containing protein [Larkinella arboricola]
MRKLSNFIGVDTPITRFQHSVGVMLLSQKLNAPLKEQIAALLHDISHTAFSHVIDHVFREPTGQSYHERMKEQYLQQSDIPPILAKYGYNWHEFVHEEAYPILEQPAPALCADRLDYFFRDGMALGLLTAAEVSQAISHLTVQDNQICVDDISTAQWLGYTYMRVDEQCWSNRQAIGLYELMAQLIQTGLQLSAICEADVWLTDQKLWDKLSHSPETDIQRQLAQLRRPVRFVEEKINPWREVSPKIRTLNPKVWINGKGEWLTDLDATFAHELAVYKQRRQGVLSLAIAH